MVGNLFNKLTNFLMPTQGEEPFVQDDNDKTVQLRSRNRSLSRKSRVLEQAKPQLTIHSQTTSLPLKIVVEEPTCFDDAQKYADYLKTNAVLLINYQKADIVAQQRIGDFMNGVCYTLGGSAQRVSEQVALYACANVDVDKILFSYSVPAYVRV